MNDYQIQNLIKNLNLPEEINPEPTHTSTIQTDAGSILQIHLEHTTHEQILQIIVQVAV